MDELKPLIDQPEYDIPKTYGVVLDILGLVWSLLVKFYHELSLPPPCPMLFLYVIQHLRSGSKHTSPFAGYSLRHLLKKYTYMLGILARLAKREVYDKNIPKLSEDFCILDGTHNLWRPPKLLHTNKCCYAYSKKLKKHATNTQILVHADGTIIYLHVEPGNVNDPASYWLSELPWIITTNNVKVYADRGYRGCAPCVVIEEPDCALEERQRKQIERWNYLFQSWESVFKSSQDMALVEDAMWVVCWLENLKRHAMPLSWWHPIVWPDRFVMQSRDEGRGRGPNKAHINYADSDVEMSD
eukprot:TRINITY_DN21278_c0_g1_i1.p1 TRINITY_DN21278_c0_g1~~TRINITY_DN21278_c0_g1_i1.p1  ORF type:complete len:299 (+),score=8.56 TRINITY_DN21278_c0_g1_i1:56-952(+)